jgi:phosphoenolpyruvate carboxylase
VEQSREPEFLPPDGPLREDVSRLGAMVGRMLAEQGGDTFFQRVEQVRIAAIHRRREGASVDELADSLAGQDAAQAEALARAFATYFQAVNTAERVHRIRRRRDYQREGSAPQPESLLAVLGQLKAEGVGVDELVGWLDRLWIEPVFTAHPTEAVRRSLLEKEQAIVASLIDGFDPRRTSSSLGVAPAVWLPLADCSSQSRNHGSRSSRATPSSAARSALSASMTSSLRAVQTRFCPGSHVE